MQYRARKLSLLLIAATIVTTLLACGSPDTSARQDQASSTAIPAAARTAASDTNPTSTRTEGPAGTPEPSNTPTQTAVPTTPTPAPMGMSRSNPFPFSAVAPVPNWDVQVLDAVRGEQARQMLAAANQLSDPVPEGMENLLVKIRAKSTSQDAGPHYIAGPDFRLTGDRLALYHSDFSVVPEDELFAGLAPGEETEGWVAFLVGQGEGNLLLVAHDPLAGWGPDRVRFIALEDGAALQVSPDLADIQPTYTELTRSAPVPLGETVSTEQWSVTVLEVVKGDEAWTMVKAADESNHPPVEGMQYVAIRARVRNIDAEGGVRFMMSNDYFRVTGDANVVYPPPSVVAPSPILDANLYPGGEHEGWVVEQAAEGETNLMARFDDWVVRDELKRYLALEDGASITSIGTPSELAGIEPETTGTDLSGPAPIGERITTEDWQLRVVDVIRGEQAWQMAEEAHRLNYPPDEGKEFVAVRAHARYIGTEDGAAHIGASSFSTIGSAETIYGSPPIYDPDPALDVELFPGAEYEGWAILQIGKDETGLIAIFEPGGSAESEKRFLSLEP